MSRKQEIWGKHEGKTSEITRLRGGYCSLGMQSITGGWLIQYEKANELAGELSLGLTTDNQSIAEAQVYQTGRSSVLHILPAMPPKPIVFRNSKKISIRQHQSLRIYLAVPLYIQLYYKQVESDNLLCEFETERLSDTWFGEPDSGTPAFTVGSRFALQAKELAAQPHEIIVPVNILNNSSQLLDLQRLLVRVDLMNIYLVNHQLIADLGTIEFKGQGHTGQLNFATDKTIHGATPHQIAKSRIASNRTILGHSFHVIKQITQL
ncbi:DUF432 domain-containing protein [Mangrovibacterium marinum]|nr:DUF432 domain-containing protein [Mangrovibacterium marinum]